jgi:dolichol-phosphate mannosyltransferase
MLLSIVLPVYNEQEVLPALFAALPPVLERIGCSYELIFIDDGSRDSTRSILNEQAAKDDRIKVLAFSRNFGQQAAITAGLDFANGDAVVVMDGVGGREWWWWWWWWWRQRRRRWWRW